jgi:hypothetical protein
MASTGPAQAASRISSSWSGGVDRSTSQKPAYSAVAASSPAFTALPFPRCGRRSSFAGRSGSPARNASTTSAVRSVLPSSTISSSLLIGKPRMKPASSCARSAKRSSSL